MKRKKANGIQNIFFSATHWLKKKKAFLREDELNAWEKQKKMWEKRFSFTFRATIATWAWRRKIGKRIKKRIWNTIAIIHECGIETTIFAWNETTMKICFFILAFFSFSLFMHNTKPWKASKKPQFLFWIFFLSPFRVVCFHFLYIRLFKK